MMVVPNPSTATIANEALKLRACAIKPIKGGPMKKPRKPIDDTDAMATPGGTDVDLPAKLYTMGTTDDTPKPTSIKPTMQL